MNVIPLELPIQLIHSFAGFPHWLLLKMIPNPDVVQVYLWNYSLAQCSPKFDVSLYLKGVSLMLILKFGKTQILYTAAQVLQICSPLP